MTALFGYFFEFFGAALPGALAKDGFHISREDNFFFHQCIHHFVVLLGVFRNEFFGACVLLIHDARNFFVDEARAFIAVGSLAKGALRVVVRHIGHLFAHTIIHHHAAGYACGLLHIVEGTGADGAEEEFFSGAPSHKGAYLVEKRFFLHAHPIFGQQHIHT